MHAIRWITVAIAALLISSTAALAQNAGVYGNQAALRASAVKVGVVLQIREVRIEGTQSATVAGSVVGAPLGGLLGAHVGQGNGKKAAIILGTALGAVAGYAAGDRIGGSVGQEVIVAVDDGNGRQNLMAVTQAGSALAAGQKVFVIGDTWSGVRIVPMTSM